jgi:hypothetical protein
VRCVRCGGIYMTEGMGKQAAAYYLAAVGVMLQRIKSNTILGVTVDRSFSWLSLYASS